MADNTQEDLSMEEILSSIKNILIEDNEPQTKETHPAEVSLNVAPSIENIEAETEDDVFDLSANMRIDEEDDDVLDLTDIIDTPISIPSPQKEMEDEADPLDLTQMVVESNETGVEQLTEDISINDYTEQFYEENSNILQSNEDDLKIENISEAITNIEQDTIPEDITINEFVDEITNIETIPTYEEDVSTATETPIRDFVEPTMIIEQAITEETTYPENVINTTTDIEPDASDNMLNNFAQMFTPSAPKTSSLGDGSKTLETLVKEVIADEVSSYVEQNLETLATHDMIMAETSRQISTWVENNLQKVVEDIVRQEIVRVMAKVGNN